MAIVPVKENPGFVEDTSLGIIIPTAVSTRFTHPFEMDGYTGIGNRLGHRHRQGLLIQKDENTGIPFWPAYASGFDDFLMRGMVQGYLGNTTQTPVPETLLSTIVTKIQGMVGTWVNTIRGKKSPVGKILDIMARADDSTFGAGEFVRNHIGALLVDNRGSICSQVPIGTIELDNWGQYGMMLEPIDSRPGQEASQFVLRMETEQFRENRGVWSLDGLGCIPTGNPFYPYWIQKYSIERGRNIWVLIHRDFGFQITQQVGPRNSLYPGFGQSGTWRYSPYAIKSMVIQRQDYEHLINQPMRGIVWVSGLDQPTQFVEQLKAYHKELEDSEMFFYPGVFFGGSVGENSKIAFLPWSEPPFGYTPEQWEAEKVSNLAASFHMNETHLRLRLGEGALTQSGVAESLEAETAIAWQRQQVEAVWNHLAPPRVIVKTVWHSDRNKRKQVDTWREMSLAISRLNKPNPNAPGSEEERLVYSRDEIRSLTVEFVGIDLPELEEDESIVTDNRTSEDMSARLSWSRQPSLLESSHADEVKFAPGNMTIFRDGSRQYARITKHRPGSSWVWVMPESGMEMLVSAGRLTLVAMIMEAETKRIGQNGTPSEIGRGYDPHIPAHRFVPGQRVCAHGNVEVTLVDVKGDMAYIAYDWDKHLFTDARPMPLSDVLPLAFQPEGSPLPPPDWRIVDPGQREAEIVAAWELAAARMDLFDMEWDEEFREYEGIPHADLVPSRDVAADNWQDVYARPVAEGVQPDPDNLTGLLIAGLLTLDEWETKMREVLANVNAAQYVIGRGGFGQIDEDDIERLSDLIYEQHQFLNGFAIAIAAGLLSEAQIIQRTRYYLSDTVKSFENGYMEAFGHAFVLPSHPGDYSSECGSSDRCHWGIEDLGDTIEARWYRTAAESCPTCIRRASCGGLTFIKVTGEYINWECYV